MILGMGRGSFLGRCLTLRRRTFRVVWRKGVMRIEFFSGTQRLLKTCWLYCLLISDMEFEFLGPEATK